MIELKQLLIEVADGRGHLTKEKFGSIVLSELQKIFPGFAHIKLIDSLDFQQDKDPVFKRADVLNSTLMAIYLLEYNDYEYEVRIHNTFKKVPDAELTNKFTWADDDALRKMDYQSLEPKDLNHPNLLMAFKCRVKRTDDDKILIPKKEGYAILFDDYKTLNEAITDVKRVIEKDSGFGGVDKKPELPVVPHMQLREAGDEELQIQVKQLEQNLEQEFSEVQDLQLYIKSNGSLFIGAIRIKPEHRRKGIGSEIIRKIKKFADGHKLIISLSPEAEPRYKERLDKFYKSLGFVNNKGRKKDYRLSEPFARIMYRRPGVDEAMGPERIDALQKQFASAPKPPELSQEQIQQTIQTFKALPGEKRKQIVRAIQRPCSNCEKEFGLPHTGKSHGICTRHFEEQYKYIEAQYKKMGKEAPPLKLRKPEDSSTDLKPFSDEERKLVVNLFTLSQKLKQKQ